MILFLEGCEFNRSDSDDICLCPKTQAQTTMVVKWQNADKVRPCAPRKNADDMVKGAGNKDSCRSSGMTARILER